MPRTGKRPSRARLVAGIFTVTAVAGVVAALLFQSTEPLTRSEVRQRVDEMNEASAVSVPHGFNGGSARRAEPGLIAMVESDRELSASDSAMYRALYQDLVRSQQRILRLLDGNLTVLTDHEMDVPNNVGAFGIAGAHDHHDASVRSNLADLSQRLASLESPVILFRAWSAVRVYKDLTDIVNHLGTVPHTKSTRYRLPARELSPVEQAGERALREFKAAQFAPVNSRRYWRSVFRGLDRLEELVLLAQDEIVRRSTPFERRLSGRWGDAQSLGPWLAVRSEPRRRRPDRGAEADKTPGGRVLQ